jgi:hypothetical protein
MSLYHPPVQGGRLLHFVALGAFPVQWQLQKLIIGPDELVWAADQPATAGGQFYLR